MTKPTHGGRREGAGRPTADNAKGLHQVNVQLTPEHIEKAKEKGEGNISLGVRRVLDASR